MFGICVAVKPTTRRSGSFRYTVLKLWKSRPAAPSTRTFLTAIEPPSNRGRVFYQTRSLAQPARPRAAHAAFMASADFTVSAKWVSRAMGSNWKIDNKRARYRVHADRNGATLTRRGSRTARVPRRKASSLHCERLDARAQGLDAQAQLVRGRGEVLTMLPEGDIDPGSLRQRRHPFQRLCQRA